MRRPALDASSRGTIVVWGLMAHAPFGGMTWQVIHYLLGLQELGHDVWYVEDTDAWMLNLAVDDWTLDPGENAGFLARSLPELGFTGRWVLRAPESTECLGALDWAGLKRLYRDADLVVNLCGSHELQPHHDAIRHLLYLETDPVASQVAVASGDLDVRQMLERYSSLFTYATNLTGADCLIPSGDLSWRITVPPVSLPSWAFGEPPTNRQLTTVLNWSASESKVQCQGQRWDWSKKASLERFADLPLGCAIPLEMALRRATSSAEEMLRSRSWRIVDARSIDAPNAYREYIVTSLGEFSVAKAQYVAPRSGWISDRTVCYLAAGRPAIVERTGIAGIPTGLGLLDFGNLEEAAAAIEAVSADYELHASAASELAAEYFSAGKVMERMLNDSGLA